MIDFHTHVLPGMDEAGPDLETCVQMVQASLQQGIDGLAPTPHFYPERERAEDFLMRRGAALQQLRRALRDREIHMPLYPGAEISYYPGISSLSALPDLCIQGTNALLLKMPVYPWSDPMIQELKLILHEWKLQPVIAHVNRHLSCQKGHVLRDLAANGVMLQADAAFFCSSETGALAMQMLRRKFIHIVGSNCRNMQDRRPDLDMALARIQRRLGDGVQNGLRRTQALLLGENA